MCAAVTLHCLEDAKWATYFWHSWHSHSVGQLVAVVFMDMTLMSRAPLLKWNHKKKHLNNSYFLFIGYSLYPVANIQQSYRYDNYNTETILYICIIINIFHRIIVQTLICNNSVQIHLFIAGLCVVLGIKATICPMTFKNNVDVTAIDIICKVLIISINYCYLLLCFRWNMNFNLSF